MYVPYGWDPKEVVESSKYLDEELTKFTRFIKRIWAKKKEVLRPANLFKKMNWG